MLVVDASVMVAVCSREAGRYEDVEDLLERHADRFGTLYAPGVLMAEVLFALCRKLQAGDATPEQHGDSIRAFVAYAAAILPPPGGDHALIERAEQIREGFGCSRSADGLYLALAEVLARQGDAVLVTYDLGMVQQAAAVALGAHVRLVGTDAT